ncbi:MAG: DHHA1 domain-containing protein, partial [Coriobacteriia bacterium]|nr:DHHA1 domain-containing protein [Coriobacteriia bacterium]
SSESSVGANLRRIEAITSFDALAYLNDLEKDVKQSAQALKVKPQDLPDKVGLLTQKIKELEHELKTAKQSGSQASDDLNRLLSSAYELSYPVVIGVVEGYDSSSLRELWDRIHQNLGEGAAVLATVKDGAPLLLAAASKKAVEEGFHAGNLIKQIAPQIQGGGGGKPSMAQAGGKNAQGIDQALDEARRILELK